MHAHCNLIHEAYITSLLYQDHCSITTNFLFSVGLQENAGKTGFVTLSSQDILLKKKKNDRHDCSLLSDMLIFQQFLPSPQLYRCVVWRRKKTHVCGSNVSLIITYLTPRIVTASDEVDDFLRGETKGLLLRAVKHAGRLSAQGLLMHTCCQNAKQI